MRTRLYFIMLATITAFSSTLQADDSAKAQKIIDRAIKVIAGDEDIAKTKNSIIDDAGIYYGMGEGQPYVGRYVMTFGEKTRYRMEIIGAFVMVADGDKAWASAAGQTNELDGIALDAAKEENQVGYVMSLLPLRKPNGKYKLGLVDSKTIGGEECSGVSVDHEGMPTLTMWFSNKTGLMKQAKHKVRSAELNFQEVEDTTIFHEYGEFEGIKSPTKMTIYRDGKKFVESNPSKVSYPATVDDSEFEKP